MCCILMLNNTIYGRGESVYVLLVTTNGCCFFQEYNNVQCYSIFYHQGDYIIISLLYAVYCVYGARGC